MAPKMNYLIHQMEKTIQAESKSVPITPTATEFHVPRITLFLNIVAKSIKSVLWVLQLKRKRKSWTNGPLLLMLLYYYTIPLLINTVLQLSPSSTSNYNLFH
jgi:hypothetical protein